MLLCALVLTISTLLPVKDACADPVEGLYESRQKISDGAASELPQHQLIRDAFTHVLIKVSGQENIQQLPGYDNLLANADKSVQLFRYETDQQGSQAEKWFWVRFDEHTINRLLKDNYLPVWSKIRPATLVWLSREAGGKRLVLSQHDSPEIYQALERQAEYRGIKLVFPFMDLEDQSSVSEADIWGNFSAPILAASRRYQSQATMTVSLYQETGSLWVSQWYLMMLGETYQWKTQAEQQEKALTAGIDQLANQLARQFAWVKDDRDKNAVLIQINNVATFKDYQRLQDYFVSLASIKSAALIQLQQDRLIYKILDQGDQAAMLREINSGDTLQQIETTRQYTYETASPRDFKPVILDNVDQKQADTAAVKTDQTAPSVQQEAVIEKKPELLVPDLEYWLAR